MARGAQVATCLLLTWLASVVPWQSAAADDGSAAVEPNAPYAWLFDLLDRDDSGAIAGSDYDDMPGPFRIWLLSHTRGPKRPISHSELLKLAPRMMNDIRSGRYEPVQATEPKADSASKAKAGSPERTAGIAPSTAARSPKGSGSKQKAANVLPAQYRRYDTDGDQQVGLYEWPVARLSEFPKLDRDANGFLTATELRNRNSASRAAPKPSTTPASPLPFRYRTYDKDGDGQVGLYEWRQDRLEEFAKLDLNNDGFLTPTELGEPPRATAAQARQATSEFSRRARTVFGFADRDSDGRLSKAEWERSISRSKDAPRVEASNLKFPLSVDDFVAIYLRANPRN